MTSCYPCPCCGYKVFEREPGSHAICPICHWEDNLVQLRFPEMPGGANSVSLLKAQQNYAVFGSVETRFRLMVRSPLTDDEREAEWRCVDPDRDNLDIPRSGIDYANSYPEDDFTVLYYWRPTYWRRLVS